MSQNNNIKITPNTGVNSDPKIEFTGAGISTITLSVGSSSEGSLTLSSSNSDIFHLEDSGVGIGTTIPNSKLSINQTTGSQAVDIGTDLLISSSGAFNPKITIGSSVGAASTEKMEINAFSQNDGTLALSNYGGNQLFSVSKEEINDSSFSVYRYGNYDTNNINLYENKELLKVSTGGTFTTYDALRVGTSLTVANSSRYNEIYGRLDVKAPFSTTTEYVSIVPRFLEKGALSFEAPVGTAQTDRGTQLFSISNNIDNSMFRVNDVNFKPIIEASASGLVGIGTTNPQEKLEVHGALRVTSVGSTPSEQIDINYYRDISYQQKVGLGTNNRGAISFDSLSGIDVNGNPTPASLFSIVNGGNVFTAVGYDNYSGSIQNPGIDVTLDNKIGIGTTNPQTAFEVVRDTTLTGKVFLRDKIICNEDINVGTSDLESISIEPLSPGITTYSPPRGSLLFDGRLDASLNGGQLFTILNDNSTSIFTVNRFASGLSTEYATGTRGIETIIEATSGGNVGIGTSIPSTKMDVRGGDLRVGIDTSTGLILTSPNGTTFRLVVDDSGTLSAISTTL